MITIGNDWSAVVSPEERAIGFTGENKAERREFLLPPGYGDWTVYLDIRAADGSTDVATLDKAAGGEGDRRVWTILERQLKRSGGAGSTAAAQCRAVKGDQVRKSAVMLFEVGPSLGATRGQPVDPAAIERTEQSINALLTLGQAARDGAREARDAAADSAALAVAEANRAAGIDAFTKEESDDAFADALRGAAAGAVAHMEDVSERSALRRAAVLGATTETGEGDKGPDNPYTLAGAEPTLIQCSNENFLKLPIRSSTWSGVTCTVDADGRISIDGTSPTSVTFTIPLDILVPAGKIYKTYQVVSGTASAQISSSFRRMGNETDKYYDTMVTGDKVVLSGAFTNATPLRLEKMYIWVAPGITCDHFTFYTSLTASKPDEYKKSRLETLPLPTLAPLYGDGTVCDEYDAVTGVETRRWKQVVLKGTESWTTMEHEKGVFYSTFVEQQYKPLPVAVCSHFRFGNPWSVSTDNLVYAASTRIDFRYTAATDIHEWKSYLAAQYAAGTPVTVVYQLREPVVTRHDPARVVPPAPVCNVFADAGNMDVGYHRDVTTVIHKLRGALAALS